MRSEVLYGVDYLDGTNDVTWRTANASAALRVGRWKLLLYVPWCARASPDNASDACDSSAGGFALGGRPGQRDAALRLYDLDLDPYESRDVRGDRPEVADALLSRLFELYDAAVASSRWVPLDDDAAYTAFAANENFVTWWRDAADNDNVTAYPKPPLATLNWRALYNRSSWA